MAYIDCEAASPKLSLMSEPWSEDDKSFRNRAQLNLYADSMNCGFSVFLKHPSERGKKVEINGNSKLLENMPVQSRMDRVRMQLLINDITDMANGKEVKGGFIRCYNIMYGRNGEPILTDGYKKPLHQSTVGLSKDEDGVITIMIREEKHPDREQRNGVKFKIDSGTWFKLTDIDGNIINKQEDSAKTARALAMQWNSALNLSLHDNYQIAIKEKQDRREAYKLQNGGGQPAVQSTPQATVAPQTSSDADKPDPASSAGWG